MLKKTKAAGVYLPSLLDKIISKILSPASSPPYQTYPQFSRYHFHDFFKPQTFCPIDVLKNQLVCYTVSMTKRTYQPKKLKRQRKFGYRARTKTKGGRKVIKRRIQRGRRKITV